MGRVSTLCFKNGLLRYVRFRSSKIATTGAQRDRKALA